MFKTPGFMISTFSKKVGISVNTNTYVAILMHVLRNFGFHRNESFHVSNAIITGYFSAESIQVDCSYSAFGSTECTLLSHPALTFKLVQFKQLFKCGKSCI